jgi:beta-phosphoglucomutase-like phosphatase (HAD superfamily)
MNVDIIDALIFDLDGTLVQTEKLKALSYAKAAVELCPYQLKEKAVVEAFRDVVGLSRREVATALVEKFNLVDKAAARADEFGVSKPWQAYVQIRLKYYDEMLSDPNVIREHRWTHNLEILEMAEESGCLTGLATMSRCQQAHRILDILELNSAFDFVATRDDVDCPKPDPEIYCLVAHQLGVKPGRCLVIEDSASGVKAALAAGMLVVAVATSFTRRGLTGIDGLKKEWIVDDHRKAAEVVQRRMVTG